MHYEAQAVVFYELDRALAETPLTLTRYYQAVAQYYTGQTPEHARSLPIKVIPERGTLDELEDALKPMSRRMEKYRSREWNLPLALMEAMVFSLPQPYQWRCRQAIAKRLGFLGVEPMGDGETISTGLQGMALLSEEYAHSLQSLSRMLADGHFGPEDAAELAEFEAAIDGLVARATGLKNLARKKVAASS